MQKLQLFFHHLRTKHRTMAWSCFLAVQTLAIPAYSEEKKPSAQEALLIKRIAEYWKEGEFATAKKQIVEFLQKYDQSSSKDHLLAMLGDLYYRENNFAQAANVYDQITNKEFRGKTCPNLVQSLFELKNYPAVVKFSSAYLKDEGEKENTHVRFLCAEALFRQIPEMSDPAQKQDLSKKAKALYRSLAKTKYEDFSLLPLAEVHRILGEYREAASLYVLLAGKNPEKREELLFRAANIQLKFDKFDAANTYASISRLKEKRAPIAAYNHLLLLFETGHHAELLNSQAEMVPLLSPEHVSPIKFCIASSYYFTENWKEAAVYFEQALQDQKNPSQYKNVLLSLVNCAQKMRDIPLLSRTLEKLGSSLREDPAFPQTLLIHAQLCMEAQEFKLAQNSLQELMHKCPGHKIDAGTMYDYGFLLYRDKNWAEAKKTFSSFLQTFSTDAHVPQAWRFLVNCSMQEMKNAPAETFPEKRMTMVQDLRNALSQKEVFTPDEARDYRMALIKMLFESERYNDASAELGEYFRDYDNHPSLADAHLLMAACYEKLSKEHQSYIFHVEKALSLNAETSIKKNLHLKLYNAYLSLVISYDEGKELFLDQAAEHLYQAFFPEGKDVKTENGQWLASYYYSRAKKDTVDSLAVDRSVIIFEKLLSPLQPSLEVNCLQLAELYSMQGQPSKKAALLESLVNLQKKSPELTWKFQRQSLFELAKTYEILSENEKALNTYSFIIESSTKASSFISYASLLQRARLQYSLLPDEKKNADNPQLLEILNDLKDLQIRKRLASEPTHIEAALEYAAIQSSMEPADLQSEKMLFLLKRIKEDFSSQDYQESKIRYPEKELLCQTYLQFIDAEIMRLEALKTEGEKDTGSKEMQQKAISQLESVRHSEMVTPYLQDHVKKSLDALGNTP